MAALALFCGLLTQVRTPGGAQQARPLLHEDFENAAGSPARTLLNDIFHTGGLEKNIVIDTAPNAKSAGAGGKALHWLRKDSGYYYARPQSVLTPSAGRVSVSYRVNFEAANPYWWIFSLIDPSYKVEYVRLFSGLGYPGNLLYGANGQLVYVNPDGSWRTLCAIQPGWKTLRLIADFNLGTCTVYYDDMRVPVAADIPLLNRPPTPTSPFRPMFHGYSSAGEGGFWLDDVLVQDLPPLPSAPRVRDAEAGGQDFQLARAGLQLRVSRRTGAIAGFSGGGRPLLGAGDDSYTFENRTRAMFAREHGDRVQSSKPEENRLTLTCANPALPGIVIRKTYAIEAGGEVSRRVEFTSGALEGFLTQRMRVSLDRDFAASATPLGFHFLPGLQGGEYSTLRNTPCLIRPDYSQGLGLYRARVNDRFVLPDIPTEGGTEEWDCPILHDFTRRDRPVSADARWFVFAGDASAYEQRLTGSADYRKLYAHPHPAWLDTLAGDAMYTATGIVGYIKAAAPLPVSSTIWFLNPPWGNWWSYSDPPLKLDTHVRDLAPGFRGTVPNARLSAYANGLFDRRSDVFKTHPEFGVTGKDGALTDAGVSSDAGQAATYYLQIRSPAARAYYLDMYLERVKNWKLDFLYLDGPGALHEQPDWKLETVVQSYDWLDFYRDLTERLIKQSPQAVFWSNGSLPYSDIGYLEWRDPQWQEVAGGANWRFYAFSLWLARLRQPPGHLLVPLYGNAGAQPAYSTYSVAYGWVGEGATPAFLPWQIAALEYRDLTLQTGGVQPNWQRDGGAVECHAGRKGANAIVNVISHGEGATARITLNTRELGLETGTPCLIRVLTMNRPAANAPADGSAARAFTPRGMRRVQISDAPLALDVPIQKGLLTTVILTPALAFMEHNGAQPAETGLTDTYAAQLNITKATKITNAAHAGGGQTEYALTCRYADTTLFFPYVARVSSADGGVRAVAATVNGANGVRVTVSRPGTYALTTQ